MYFICRVKLFFILLTSFVVVSGFKSRRKSSNKLSGCNYILSQVELKNARTHKRFVNWEVNIRKLRNKINVPLQLAWINVNVKKNVNANLMSNTKSQIWSKHFFFLFHQFSILLQLRLLARLFKLLMVILLFLFCISVYTWGFQTISLDTL